MYPAKEYIPSPVEKGNGDPSSLDERAWRRKVHQDTLCRCVRRYCRRVGSPSLLVRADGLGVLACCEDVDGTRPYLLPLVQGGCRPVGADPYPSSNVGADGRL